MSATANMAVRTSKNPVRMLSEQITVSAGHLRFKPQSKQHSHILDLLCQSCYARRQLVQIYIPVSKRTGIVVPLAKPSIIQNKQFNPQFPGFFCNGQDLFFIKIHVSGFPVINQNWALTISPVPSGKPFPVKCVICLTHSVQSLI